MGSMNWASLQDVLDAARLKGVWFSIHYEEPSDEWYGTVGSAAPSERTVTKSGSFDATVQRLLEWITAL